MTRFMLFYSPQLSSKEISTSLDRISGKVGKGTDTTVEQPKEEKGSINPLEKDLRNIRKKLTQIEFLKEKAAKGEKLEKTQVKFLSFPAFDNFFSQKKSSIIYSMLLLPFTATEEYLLKDSVRHQISSSVNSLAVILSGC